MGVVLYLMLTGNYPFLGESVTKLYQNIKELRYSLLETFSSSLIDLFKRIFVKNPANRIDMEGIRSHPWTTKGFGSSPERIYPTIFDQFDLTNDIQSIKRSQNCTIYTLYNFNTVSHLETSAKAITLPPKPTAYRRKGSSVESPLPDDKPTSHVRKPSGISLTSTKWESSIPDQSNHSKSIWEPPTGSDNWYDLNQPPKIIRPATLGRKLIVGNQFDPATMLQDVIYAAQSLAVKYPLLTIHRIPANYLLQVKIGPKCVVDLEIVKLWALAMHGLELHRSSGEKDLGKKFIDELCGLVDWK